MVAGDANNPAYTPFFGAIGAASAIVFSGRFYCWSNDINNYQRLFLIIIHNFIICTMFQFIFRNCVNSTLWQIHRSAVYTPCYAGKKYSQHNLKRLQIVSINNNIPTRKVSLKHLC